MLPEAAAGTDGSGAAPARRGECRGSDDDGFGGDVDTLGGEDEGVARSCASIDSIWSSAGDALGGENPAREPGDEPIVVAGAAAGGDPAAIVMIERADDAEPKTACGELPSAGEAGGLAAQRELRVLRAAGIGCVFLRRTSSGKGVRCAPGWGERSAVPLRGEVEGFGGDEERSEEGFGGEAGKPALLLEDGLRAARASLSRACWRCGGSSRLGDDRETDG